MIRAACARMALMHRLLLSAVSDAAGSDQSLALKAASTSNVKVLRYIHAVPV